MLRYEHGIGDKAHTNRRIGRLSATLSFVRLHEFFGDADLGGWRTQLELLASVNTVRFALDPREEPVHVEPSRPVALLLLRLHELLGGPDRLLGGRMLLGLCLALGADPAEPHRVAIALDPDLPELVGLPVS